MLAHKSSLKTTCPTCGGTTTNGRNPQQVCSTCGGQGQIDKHYPFPWDYPFNLTVVAPGLPAGFVPPSQFVGSPQGVTYPGNPNQTGVNPALLKTGNQNPFRWVFNVVRVTSPYIIGDASDWLMLFALGCLRHYMAFYERADSRQPLRRRRAQPLSDFESLGVWLANAAFAHRLPHFHHGAKCEPRNRYRRHCHFHRRAEWPCASSAP